MTYWIKFSLVAMTTAYIVLGYIAYCLFWPATPFVISTPQPIALNHTMVHPGDYLEYTLSYCKEFSGYPVVRRSLIDGQIITLKDTPGGLPQGCHTTVVRTAQVPDTINPGKYYLLVDNEYEINPFHYVHVSYRTDYFNVVDGASASSTAGVTLIR